jgi:hypothetical protein
MSRLKLDWLRKLLDPRGPAGEVVSPFDIYKSGRGLPFSVGHRQRAELAPIPFAEIEKALAPERYYAKGEIEVPYSRERVVSPYILERFSPVMQGMVIVGWRVSQEARSQFCDCTSAKWAKSDGQFVHAACGRRRAPLSDEQFMEKALTIQKAPDDAIYDMYAVTVPGTDRAIIDGMEVTGGTHIKSRRDYDQKVTKRGFVHWDAGTPKCVEKALAEEKSKREATTARGIERKVHRLVSEHPGDI